ncbi:MAG: hypothetical protein V3V19_02225 [Cocleimonas sp.]
MKNLSLLIMALLTAGVLTACGGGEKSNSTADTGSSAELIIDNGRGTVNGHDTEVPK